MTFLRIVIRSIFLFEHNLRANASRFSRRKTGPHFSGSCSRRLHFSVLAAELSSRVRRLLQAEEAEISAEARSEAVLPTAGTARVCGTENPAFHRKRDRARKLPVRRVPRRR